MPQIAGRAGLIESNTLSSRVHNRVKRNLSVEPARAGREMRIAHVPRVSWPGDRRQGHAKGGAGASKDDADSANARDGTAEVSTV